MKVVAWGFSMPGLASCFAREIARSPARSDVLLQIDPDTRTIDFSSVRIAEFLRTDFRQVEGLLRSLGKERSVAVVFDVWRFLLCDGFEDALPLLRKVAELSSRCILLAPRRVSHVDLLFPFGLAARGQTPAETESLALWIARIRLLHESVLNAPSSMTLLVSAPPVECFWGLLGANALLPATFAGVKFTPADLRDGPAQFTSFSQLAREAAALVSLPTNASDAPWVVASAGVPVGLSEGVRGFECSWQHYVNVFSKRADSGTSLAPAFSSPGARAVLARFLFALARHEKRVESPSPTRFPSLGILFPSLPMDA